MMTVMMMMMIMLMMKMKIMLMIKDDDDEAECGQKQREPACKGTQVQPARQVAATGLCVHQWTAPVARTAMKTLYTNYLNYFVLLCTSPILTVYSTVQLCFH